MCWYPSGAKYDGEWKEDRKDGFGSYQYASGHHYVGQWKRGKKEGHGKFTSRSGAVYVGRFQDDKPSEECRRFKRSSKSIEDISDGILYPIKYQQGLLRKTVSEVEKVLSAKVLRM